MAKKLSAKQLQSWVVVKPKNGAIMALRYSTSNQEVVKDLRKKGYRILGYPYFRTPKEAIDWVKAHLGL